MNGTIAYFEGAFMPFADIRIDPNDRGFITADAVFDAARTFDGVGFQLEAHIARLYDSLRVARIDAGMEPERMLEITGEVIARNEAGREDVGDYQVWQWVTRGPGRWAHEAGPASVCVKVSPVDFAKFAHLYETGAHAVVTGVESPGVRSIDPKLKTHSRMYFNLAELEAAAVDPAGWPLLVDDRGNLTEGSGYNVFVVRDNAIATPGARNVLGGISRRFAIALARELGFDVVEGELQRYHLITADEAFFTGTSPCVLPVTRVDGMPIGTGAPGPVTAALLEAWSGRVGVDIAAQARKYA